MSILKEITEEMETHQNSASHENGSQAMGDVQPVSVSSVSPSAKSWFGRKAAGSGRAPRPSMGVLPEGVNPQPVVKVLSPRGVEYLFMTIALLTGAFSLAMALLSLVNGKVEFATLIGPVAGMLGSLPVFAFLFLRLKEAELNDPAARFDPSKRRSTQFIQIVSFLFSFFTLIGFIAILLYKMAGQYDGVLWKTCLDVLVIEVVAGGLLYYYWRDEHRPL